MPKRNPDQVAVLMDISGKCGLCHKKGTARLVAYFSGEVIMRCQACGKSGEFHPDNSIYNDPRKFAPAIFDNDQQDNNSQVRYQKGKR